MRLRNANLSASRGVAYIWMLLTLVLLGLGIGQWATNYATQQQRYKEQELLRVGEMYREAIRRYCNNSPAGIEICPYRLEDLLHDPRQIQMTRYIRKVWKDPITNNSFELIKNTEGMIIGVRSSSTRRPIKQKKFLPYQQGFENANTYQDWQFRIKR